MPSTGTFDVKMARIGRRRLAFDHRGGSARQDDAPGVEFLDLGLVDQLEGVDFAVHPGLAHPPGNQLGDLGTEIDDQQAVGHGGI